METITKWRGLEKMQEIIKAQGGKANIDSEDITIGAVKIILLQKKWKNISR